MSWTQKPLLVGQAFEPAGAATFSRQSVLRPRLGLRQALRHTGLESPVNRQTAMSALRRRPANCFASQDLSGDILITTAPSTWTQVSHCPLSRTSPNHQRRYVCSVRCFAGGKMFIRGDSRTAPAAKPAMHLRVRMNGSAASVKSQGSNAAIALIANFIKSRMRSLSGICPGGMLTGGVL